MTGGSESKENPQDTQCPHCDLWYQGGQSFKMHKVNCGGTETDDSNSSVETDSNAGGGGGGGSEVMGSGSPDDPGTELPCGHERIDLDEYDSGDKVRCDTCGKVYPLS